MAAEMTEQSRMDKIRNDYENTLMLLQKCRHEAETHEKDRLDKLKEYRIKQMIISEKKNDLNPDDQMPTSSKNNMNKTNESSSENEETSSSSSEEDEDVVTNAKYKNH